MLWQREALRGGGRRTLGLLGLEGGRPESLRPFRFLLVLQDSSLLHSQGNTHVAHFLFSGSNSVLPPVRQARKWTHKDTFPLSGALVGCCPGAPIRSGPVLSNTVLMRRKAKSNSPALQNLNWSSCFQCPWLSWEGTTPGCPGESHD